MREKFDLVREIGRGAFGEASNAAEARRSWALYFGVAAAAGAFLAYVGAFETGEAPALVRILYWIPAIVFGSIAGQIGVRFINRTPLRDAAPPLRIAVVSLLIALATTAVIWVATALVFGLPLSMGLLLRLFGMVLVVSATMASLFTLLALARTRETRAGPTAPRFLERLPPKLRGGELFAVEAEDHYLRLHTSKGQDLILMRLSDAITELDGIEGLQVHRSWWVARDGVAEVKRTQGKVYVALKDGAEAPVARNNVRTLREAGWL